MKQSLVIIFAFAAMLATNAFSQESTTLTTYSVVPSGNFVDLRLVPKPGINPATDSCKVGSMFVYDDATSFDPYYCHSTGAGVDNGHWGLLAGIWRQVVDGPNTNVFVGDWDDPNMKVGIGTNDPATRLTVEGGAVLFEGSTGAPPVTEEIYPPALIWIPEKSALRVGRGLNDVWADEKIGMYSMCFGFCEASGETSFALGTQTIASGKDSTAIGEDSIASGEASTAIGRQSDFGHIVGDPPDVATASGNYSTAIGYYPFALAEAATAFGWDNDAEAIGSTSMGYGGKAQGNYSTVMGYWDIPSGTGPNQAVGEASTAMGVNAKAYTGANYSTAMGWGVQTKYGEATTAIGYKNIAHGAYSTTIGAWIQTHEYATGSVGIGLNSIYPPNRIDQTNTMAIMGGQVGIGTVAPNATLHINYTLRLEPQVAEPVVCDASTEGTLFLFGPNAQAPGALCFCIEGNPGYYYWNEVAVSGAICP